jgi:intracellular septation protein A
VDASRDAKPPAGTNSEIAVRLRSIAKIVIIDVAAPLIAYSLLRSAGMSTVTALVLSGVFPALGVAIGVIQHRRLDVVGALVLTGILVGTVLGLISHSARLVLMEGSVPTAIFGLACLGSLWTRRPLMYSFSLEFIGPDTAKGREMISLWQYEGFRHIFRIITAVWGVGFLLEAGLRVAIVYNTSTDTALALSKVTPYIWTGIFVAWTVAYGKYQGKKGRRIMAATAAAVEGPGTSDADPRPADITKTADQA